LIYIAPTDINNSITRGDDQIKKSKLNLFTFEYNFHGKVEACDASLFTAKVRQMASNDPQVRI